MPPRKRITELTERGKSLICRDEHGESRPAHRIAGGTKFGGKSEKSSRSKKDGETVPGLVFIRGG